jgi:hypothetical protein
LTILSLLLWLNPTLAVVLLVLLADRAAVAVLLPVALLVVLGTGFEGTVFLLELILAVLRVFVVAGVSSVWGVIGRSVLVLWAMAPLFVIATIIAIIMVLLQNLKLIIALFLFFSYPPPFMLLALFFLL